MQERLFRKAALEKLSSPEQLDQLMQITTPRAWLIMAGLATLLVAALLWGIFGTIPTTIPGQGLLIRGDGIQTIEAVQSGQVAKLLVKAGDLVQAGQQVAIIKDGTQEQPVTSPFAARVLELRVNEGNVVQVGTPLLSLEQSDQEMRIVVYLPVVEGKRVKPGMTVQIAPSTVRSETYGVMFGKVVSVGDFPVTYQGMLRVLGSEELIRALPQGAASIQVVVEPIKANTPSGYQWSSPDGPPITLQSGTFCNATIIVEERRPISLVFGS